ncbi:3-oxoacid CoA-transferase subunit A [Comamonas testosteroni]|uniref:3-oxoacid CoA-transferase, A subunit n=2 Tax=Comamonas testosteroni TaxID=285 RepID=B7X5E5_COMTK|nr:MULTISPECIES: 3-oxoacid CoA-transferase subunit A [Comamonas]AIJ47434.1 3-oxoadipate CoA-transferase subunit A [Comamonas testosteroni TK102]EED66937.1 3-oxoacid CoA-transferase, A subunit [Comamonas testosteroni KF-1]TYK68772.1 3-oxoacid CoA-transferase subunit A [Comamonas sp. Z3]WQG65149.1 3-oxoacid CoA-transferase subunit A [Comamonas testosteroni]
MLDKIHTDIPSALADIVDGATVLVGGFGGAGLPYELVHGLIDQGARDLTIVNNNSGTGHGGLAALVDAGRVRKMICSFPKAANPKSDPNIFSRWYREGRIELELVPQGTIVERLRAAAAGLGGVYCPTGVGTLLAKGKEMRMIGGKPYLLELPLHGDFALIKAHQGDRWGNLTYRKAARNFNPVMAMAAKVTIAQVHQTLDLGQLDPEHVVTPGIFVQRVVNIAGAQS